MREEGKHHRRRKKGHGKQSLRGITILVPGKEQKLESVGEAGKQAAAYADVRYLAAQTSARKTDQTGAHHGQRKGRDLGRVDGFMKQNARKKGHPRRSREHENDGDGSAAFLNGNLQGKNHEGNVDRAEQHHAHEVALSGMQAAHEHGVDEKAHAGNGHAPERHGGRLHAFCKAHAGHGPDDGPRQRGKHAVHRAEPEAAITEIKLH